MMPPGRTPKVLLALGVAAETKGGAVVLQQAGYAVSTCAPGDAMRLALQVPPDVLLLDGEMDRGRLMTALRVLGRNPDTRAVVTLLVGSPKRAEREGLRLFDAFDILARPLGREKVLAAVARAAAWAGELREMFGLRGQGAGTSRKVEGCDAILARPVGCPFHDPPALCQMFVLRTGKIAAEVGLCDIPTYTHAVGGGDFIDYNRVSVTVCPKCLFASAAEGDFVDLRDGADPAAGLAQFKPEAHEAIGRGGEARQLLCGDVGPTMFGHARTAEEAATAHRLAAHCAQALWRSNTQRMSRFACQAADAYMTAAMLEGRADVVRLVQLEARDLLVEAVAHVDGPALPRAMFQLVALGALLDDDRSAFDYMRALDDLRGKGDARLIAAADRYYNRAKRIWTDRTFHRSAA